MLLLHTMKRFKRLQTKLYHYIHLLSLVSFLPQQTHCKNHFPYSITGSQASHALQRLRLLFIVQEEGNPIQESKRGYFVIINCLCGITTLWNISFSFNFNLGLNNGYGD